MYIKSKRQLDIDEGIPLENDKFKTILYKTNEFESR